MNVCCAVVVVECVVFFFLLIFVIILKYMIYFLHRRALLCQLSMAMPNGLRFCVSWSVHLLFAQFHSLSSGGYVGLCVCSLVLYSVL